jgi:TonB family protein
MVLIHELAHVRRRDIVAQLFALLVCAFWWFQPLCWIARWNLRRESERACDAVVLSLGIRASEYAAELLDLAQNFAIGQRWAAGTIAMARPNELEGRLTAILDQPAISMARRASLAALSGLVLLTVTASAVTPTSKQTVHLSGGSSMKHSVFTGLLFSAGLSAATIGGSVFDPSGAVVPGAKALLYNPDTGVKQEAVTASDGKFIFDNLNAGEYILRIEKTGFASLFREFDVEPDSKVQRGLVLNLADIQENVSVQAPGAPVAVPQPTNPQTLRVGGAVEQSKLTTKVNPVYPPTAKQAGVQGQVILEAVISKTGVPIDVRVISSPSDDLTQSSLEAVRQWRYEPTLLNGNPVEIVTQIDVNYTIVN